MFCSALSAATSTAEDPAKESDANNLHYADLVQAAAKFDEMRVWKGLPHPLAEADSLAKELAAKKTIRIGDQYFYAVALPLKDEEKAALSEAVLKHVENFKLWSGFKFCGGFHADYAVEWRYKGAVLAQALFCFSCEEAQFRVGDRTEQVDQSEDGLKYFRALLLPHRQQRPVFQSTEATASSSRADKRAAPERPTATIPPIKPPDLPKLEISPPPVTPVPASKK